MKIQEMREMTPEAIRQAIDDLNSTLFHDRMKHGARQLENTASLRTGRHRLAQLKTVLREMEQQEEARHV